MRNIGWKIRSKDPPACCRSQYILKEYWLYSWNWDTIIVQRYRVISENNSSLAECQSCLAGEAAGGGDFGLSYGTGSYISIIHWNFIKKKNATQILRSTCETNALQRAVDHGKISLYCCSFCIATQSGGGGRSQENLENSLFVQSLLCPWMGGPSYYRQNVVREKNECCCRCLFLRYISNMDSSLHLRCISNKKSFLHLR